MIKIYVYHLNNGVERTPSKHETKINMLIITYTINKLHQRFVQLYQSRGDIPISTTTPHHIYTYVKRTETVKEQVVPLGQICISKLKLHKDGLPGQYWTSKVLN